MDLNNKESSNLFIPSNKIYQIFFSQEPQDIIYYQKLQIKFFKTDY